MATTAFGLLLLGALVGLGRPSAPLTPGDLPAAALRGVAVLSRLSDRRRARLRPADPRPLVDHGVVATAPRSSEVRVPAATP